VATKLRQRGGRGERGGEGGEGGVLWEEETFGRGGPVTRLTGETR